MANDEPTNDIDKLMSLTPPLSAVDIDEVIRIHRAQRARRAKGEKAELPKVDIGKILNLKPAVNVPNITRRMT